MLFWQSTECAVDVLEREAPVTSIIRLASSRLPGNTWPVVTSTRTPRDGIRGEAIRHPQSEVVRVLNAAEGREVEGYNSRHRQIITATPRGPLIADTVQCGIQYF